MQTSLILCGCSKLFVIEAGVNRVKFSANKMNPYVLKALKEFLKKRNDIFGDGSEFQDFKYDLPAVQGNVEGLQSSSAQGCIRYSKKGDIFLSPPLYLKSMPPIKSDVVLVQFINEIFFYGHVLPFFTNLEPSFATLFPKFYGSSTQTYPQSSEATIILENVWHTGYKTAPCKSFLDYPHLSLMIKSLGKFHACSYLAKQIDPKRFSSHASVLNPIHSCTTGQFPGGLTKLGARGLTRLAQQNEYTHFIPIIQRLLDNADQFVVKLFKHERYNSWAVICHGDYLSGNVLFKYEGDHPIDMKMIDFAMSTYSSPALDLALLLYINADQKTRDLYWERLIDDYFDGLSSLSVEVNYLPSRENIMDEFQKNAFYAYLIATFWLSILITDDFNRGDFRQFLPPEYAHCKNRSDLPKEILHEMHLKIGGEMGTVALTDILKDMLKRGFINCSRASANKS